MNKTNNCHDTILMRKNVSEQTFGLVSLFNGISTIKGYLMSKLFSQKNSSCTI